MSIGAGTKLAALAAAMISFTVGANAGDNSEAETFAAERFAAFGKGDVERLVAQYRDDAVVITPMGTLTSRDAIRSMMEGVVAEFAQPDVKFQVQSQAAIGDVVSFVWSAETGKAVYDMGAETYVLEDGKVAYQTLALKMTPK